MLDRFIKYDDGVLSIDLKFPVRALKGIDAPALVKSSASNVLASGFVLSKNVYDAADARFGVTQRITTLDQQYHVVDTIKSRSAAWDAQYHLKENANEALTRLERMPTLGRVVLYTKDGVLEVRDQTLSKLAQQGIVVPGSPSAASDASASDEDDATDKGGKGVEVHLEQPEADEEEEEEEKKKKKKEQTPEQQSNPSPSSSSAPALRVVVSDSDAQVHVPVAKPSSARSASRRNRRRNRR